VNLRNTLWKELGLLTKAIDGARLMSIDRSRIKLSIATILPILLVDLADFSEVAGRVRVGPG
jgi:hypothetical protein